MKLIDKLLDRLAEKVIERMKDRNAIMIDAEKIKDHIEQEKYDDEMVKRIVKGHHNKNEGHNIKVTSF